ncbi:MAG: ATP-dependent RNA helicase HrpA [Kangiellaceae bacterium]|jgi:ATP-dependent helicase HrpA|nr:ATP-dependent RNA helicase HrpA [Kangiellaceae bacterium]
MSSSAPINFSQCATKDIGRIIKLQHSIKRAKGEQKEKLLKQLELLVEQSKLWVEHRQSKCTSIDFPQQLPVSRKVAEIAELIKHNQVIVLAGETGSGKTTQLPKICLQAGLGRRGLIAHTQPRRVAATSVSARIAEELNVTLGQEVGVSVRFFDKFTDDTLVKVMTDGMLLSEIQHDKLLSKYEVVIIDEAHERSINIDFLLGLLKRVLSKRKELKVIITSATIDLEKFSSFFNQAPIVTVEGRTYPVEVKYLPQEFTHESSDLSAEDYISWAVNDLVKQGPGDVLIFLPGEGEIRQIAKQLRKLNLAQTQILPLYARLSIAEQQKVFKQVQGRKIVLATNVAETSLTVPGIRYVIDPGTARISRFSMRSKIQRLQIEKISKASANQRAGRCGRVSSGICYRLYSEDDFDNRADFTLPEIKRTNLASVILQMKHMGIDNLLEFPFIESPEEKHWGDGVNLLFELGALDKEQKLTGLGKNISVMPVDPKLAVLMHSGIDRALNEMLVIASLYSVRDPRERPHDKQEKADQMHAQWDDKKSDFITYLNLWNGLHKHQEELSNRAFKDYCKSNFINFVAWLEWRNTYRQLKQLMTQKGYKISQQPASYEALHQSLLPALLSNLLNKTTEQHYLGARNTKIFIHPSSVNFKKSSDWLVAAELMETTKLYARTTAPVKAEWIEQAAEHLSKASYLEVHWRKKKGEACAFLQKSVFGLIYVKQRLVSYSRQEPAKSRLWMIEKGLINDEIIINAPFHKANQAKLNQFREEETKHRRSDIIKNDEALIEWFEEKLPKHIVCVKQLVIWLKKNWQKNNQELTLQESDILNPETDLDESAFPKILHIRGSEISLDYRFEPGHEDDGVSICLPLPILNQFKATEFEWLVPGLLKDKILHSIKALPKALRKNFIPAPEYAQAAYERLEPRWGEGDFYIELATVLSQISGVDISIAHWRQIELPDHLRPNFKIYDDNVLAISKGRSLEALQTKLKQKVHSSLQNIAQQLPSDGKDDAGAKGQSRAKHQAQTQALTTWPEAYDFKLEIEQTTHQAKTKLLQAMADQGSSVKVVGSESRYSAELTHTRGIARLLVLSVDKKLKYFLRSWHSRNDLKRLATQAEGYERLVDDLALAIAKHTIEEHEEQLTDGLVETFAQYKLVQHYFDQVFNEQMNDWLTRLLDLFKASQKISKQVYERIEPKYMKNYMDIREQLDFLWQEGFVYKFGLEQLTHYKRYFAALKIRLDRMEMNYPREQQCLRQISEITRRVNNLASSPHNRRYTELKHELNWMLQELRISLFAQTIKTAFPISEKRIEKKMAELKLLV